MIDGSVPRSSSTHSGVGLIVFVAAVVVVATIGSAVTQGSVDTWYETLDRPSWRPPNWVFGPAWTILYATIAGAAWLVWRERVRVSVTGPLVLWSVQLALNLGWTIVFFGLESPGGAVIEIGLLMVAISATIVAFSRVRRIAGLMLVPYLAWTTFAAALTVDIFVRN